MPVKLLRFGKGPVPVKKANAYEDHLFGKGPEPVKKANACEAIAFWERPGAYEEGQCP